MVTWVSPCLESEETEWIEEEGNETLATWFEEGEEGQLAITGRALIVKTADGGWAKVRMLSLEDGELSFEWAYAGAGRDDF